jgi:CheY-like chemotaxis protein
VNAFLRSTKSFLRRVIGEAVDLELCLGNEILPVCTDVQQLNSAILNLTINAADAMPSGGSLTIETKRACIDASTGVDALKRGSYVVISVRDTGSGMREEVARRAVEPFFTTKQPGEGSGLGLSMVYGFAKQSGGSLHIRSSPGRGTDVSLFLPEGEAGAIAAKADVPTAAPAKPHVSECILVVEDEPRLRKFACRSLATRGYSVLEAADAETAKNILASRPDIDVLFSDIVMPGPMNGTGLAHWAAQHRPGLRVLLTTGFSEDVYVIDAMDKTACPVLEKPYTQERLLMAIRDLLDAPEAECARPGLPETAHI